jgi:hypothetical protein
MLGDKMNIGKKSETKNEAKLSLEDMIGRYKSIEPINSVDLKHKLK